MAGRSSAPEPLVKGTWVGVGRLRMDGQVYVAGDAVCATPSQIATFGDDFAPDLHAGTAQASSKVVQPAKAPSLDDFDEAAAAPPRPATPAAKPAPVAPRKPGRKPGRS